MVFMSLTSVAYKMENPEKEQILSEIISTQSLPDYEAFDALWVLLTRTANLMLGESECELGRQRMESLFEKLSEEEIKRLLKDKSIDLLVFLDPPLETVICEPNERLNEGSTMRAIGKVRSLRETEPNEALINLGKILKRIRDKSAYGFKTESGLGDNEILSPARKILYLLCILAISKLN